MIRDAFTTSLLLVVCVLALGVAFGSDGVLLLRVSLFVAALPFAFASLMQWRTIGARGQAQIELLLNRDLNHSGRVGDVVESVHTKPVHRNRPEMQQPERVRLITLHSPSSSIVAASEVESISGDTTRLVVAPPVKLIDGANESDLLEFVNGLHVRGHARRSWLGFKFASGRECDADYHALLIKPLEKCGAVIERGERKAGRLVMPANEITERLGLGRSDDGADA